MSAAGVRFAGPVADGTLGFDMALPREFVLAVASTLHAELGLRRGLTGVGGTPTLTNELRRGKFGGVLRTLFDQVHP